MDINLVVTLTFSERLFQLIEDHVPTIQHRVENAVNKQVKASAKEETKVKVAITTVPPSPACIPAPADPIVAIDEARAGAIREPAKAKAPKKAEEPAKVEEPAKKLELRVRKIIEDTRKRLEGEDYQENSASEGYKKYHRALTSQFRQIATILGYDKPTKIDDPEKVEKFAAMCAELTIGEDGLISPAKAPF